MNIVPVTTYQTPLCPDNMNHCCIFTNDSFSVPLFFLFLYLKCIKLLNDRINPICSQHSIHCEYSLPWILPQITRDKIRSYNKSFLTLSLWFSHCNDKSNPILFAIGVFLVVFCVHNMDTRQQPKFNSFQNSN